MNDLNQLILNLQEAGWNPSDVLNMDFDMLISILESRSLQSNDVQHVTADEYIQMFGVV